MNWIKNKLLQFWLYTYSYLLEIYFSIIYTNFPKVLFTVINNLIYYKAFNEAKICIKELLVIDKIYDQNKILNHIIDNIELLEKDAAHIESSMNFKINNLKNNNKFFHDTVIKL